ncbi:MAG TPA: GNAT family N-acetyltransferase [Dyella sp.]|uniref:GNAT family N-acetyltransferase n=1 Tax=Dyella sp. TaxID=1869338 RepID=UPI002F94B553
MTAIRYFTPTAADAISLRAMAREAFADTFAHLYDEAPFAHFLDRSYGPGGSMECDLDNPAVRWLIAATDEKTIGYAKLSPLRAPAPEPQPGALELQQIYILRAWHGQGIADRLMTWALNDAREQGAPEIYLTVFDHNQRAKRFYSRYGFAEVGRCTFTLGDRIDDDRVWRKSL